ncbi:MAG: urea ABC transporter substrate-binding protein [Candidatus Wallbacteria bacterium]|nr:urea ABC transporter substrate-binding protein [Candidatus Wallbacteria bacterium]
MSSTVIRGPILAGLLVLAAGLCAVPLRAESQPIRVGVLHSLTGTMAISEKSLVDAISMAIAEVNAAGGVLGRKLEAVVADGASDWPTFAKMAEKLITEDRVSSVFGCWTSASRKAVLPVFEKRDHLLWYPVQYEGCESSPNVIYTGAAPNQQIMPAVEWCAKRFGKKFFLVGSDYIFPRTANKLVRAQVASLGGECLGEEYRPLGDKDFAAIVAQIKTTKPDVIFNTINGDSNSAFFKELDAAGLKPESAPVMSMSIAEDELRVIGTQLTAGHYCAWNYFQSVDSPENQKFIAAFKKAYGADRVTDDPIEAAYFQVFLFAKAVEKAGSADVAAVRKAARGLTYSAPGGLVKIDPKNQHTWKVARIGQTQPDGQFKILWASEGPVKPQPYPKLLFPNGPGDLPSSTTSQPAAQPATK